MENMRVLIILFILVIMCKSQSQDKCVYQLDMENNKVKISCGPGVVLNIIDHHGNTLLSGETNTKEETPVIFQVNRSNIASVKHEYIKATKKLTDASKLLRKAREELTVQVNNLINLTSLLQRGDEELKRDLDTLRRHELTSPLVREAIIAALQNQYNFLRMGLLAQNTHLNELIRTTMRVTTTVIKTARGARAVGEILNLRADVMNTTLTNITKLMPGGFTAGAFFGEQTVFCPQTLRSISTTGTSIIVGVEQGTTLRDPFTPNKVWVTYGYQNVNEVTEYDSVKGLKFEVVGKLYELPFSCVGTGHVIYKQVLYCQKMYTRKIVRYSLAESRWLGEKEIDSAGIHDTFPYQSGKFSDFDFAVDEVGLWLMYASNSSRGNIVISKINEEDLTFEQSWVTDIPKREVGNAFIICSILYATDSFKDTPTYIKYAFDTVKVKQVTLSPKHIPFKNAILGDFARVYSLDYSPGDKALYSWNNGRVEIYPVSFSSENEP